MKSSYLHFCTFKLVKDTQFYDLEIEGGSSSNISIDDFSTSCLCRGVVSCSDWDSWVRTKSEWAQQSSEINTTASKFHAEKGQKKAGWWEGKQADRTKDWSLSLTTIENHQSDDVFPILTI